MSALSPHESFNLSLGSFASCFFLFFFSPKKISHRSCGASCGVYPIKDKFLRTQVSEISLSEDEMTFFSCSRSASLSYLLARLYCSAQGVPVLSISRTACRRKLCWMIRCVGPEVVNLTFSRSMLSNLVTHGLRSTSKLSRLSFAMPLRQPAL
jgi:hypothetical protein